MAQNRQEIAIYDGSGGSAVPQSNVHTYDSYHTKGEPWNSLMKAVIHQDSKIPNSARNGKKIGVGWHFQIGHTYDSYHTKGEP